MCTAFVITWDEYGLLDALWYRSRLSTGLYEGCKIPLVMRGHHTVGWKLYISNSRITHFITDNDVLRRAVEKSCQNVVTNFMGSTGKNKKECIHIPLSPLPSRTWNLIGGENEMFSKIKNEDLAALEDALSDKVAVSTQVAVKRDLRLLKRKAKKKNGLT